MNTLLGKTRGGKHALQYRDKGRAWVRDVDTWLLMDRVNACIEWLTEAIDFRRRYLTEGRHGLQQNP